VPAPVDSELRFLVVDDSPSVRHILRNYLRAFGYTQVLEAPDGLKAYELIKNRHIDFVICDWVMPGMSGLDLLRRLRARPETRGLPFIMITGEKNEAAVAEACEAQVDAYLVKPFTAQALQEKIEGLLAARRRPSPIDQALEEGERLVAQGRAQDALERYRQALSLNPRSPRTLYAMGLAHEALDQTEQALECYRQAVELSPRFVKAHDRAAALLTRLGRPDEAETHLRQAIRTSPRQARRHLALGRALLAQGKRKEAAAVLEGALRRAGDDAELAREVGELFLAAGLYDQAAQAFQGSLDIDPRVVHVYNRLGIVYRRQGKPEQAIEAYQRALAIAPQDENLHFNLAVAHLEAGHKDQALRMVERALELNPDFAEAKALQAHLRRESHPAPREQAKA
jgi:tetratricopeptide (TPR) repeat protein